MLSRIPRQLPHRNDASSPAAAFAKPPLKTLKPIHQTRSRINSLTAVLFYRVRKAQPVLQPRASIGASVACAPASQQLRRGQRPPKNPPAQAQSWHPNRMSPGQSMIVSCYFGNPEKTARQKSSAAARAASTRTRPGNYPACAKSRASSGPTPPRHPSASKQSHRRAP